MGRKRLRSALLAHQAGLPKIESDVTLDDACAWAPVVDVLAAQAPAWEPGTQYAYHAGTWGYLVGELIRRITGTTVGSFFASEVVQPLELSAWIGLPAAVEPRVAHLEDPEPAAPDSYFDEMFSRLENAQSFSAPARDEVRQKWQDSDGDVTQCGAFPRLVEPEGGHNARQVHEAELPSTNMITNARSLAKLYASTVGTVAGVNTLDRATVEAMTAVQDATPYLFDVGSEAAALAKLLDPPFLVGFMQPSLWMPLLGPGSFGHPGYGGSIGAAHLGSGVAFGYIVNRMASRWDDPRGLNLLAATRRCANL